MTTQADWAWRAEYLNQQAAYLETKADELKSEAGRYRGLAEQAGFLARRMGDPNENDGLPYSYKAEAFRDGAQ